jgi:hypothetical protein
MRGAIPLLPCMPSWQGQRELYGGRERKPKKFTGERSKKTVMVT